MRTKLVLVHRYLGLALAGLLFLAGLTGAMLAFQRELDAALNPDLYRAQSTGAILPMDILKTRAEQQLAGAAVVAIQPPWRPGESVMVSVEPSSGAAPLAYDEAFLDPHNGQMLGKRLWGSCCFERVNLIPFIYKLHFSLHLPGVWGLWITGGAAALWTFDCFVALALAAPRRRGVTAWRRVLSIKLRTSDQRRIVDLHRAPGLWLWAILLIIAATGVGLNLRDQVFAPIVSLFSPVAPPIFERPVPAKSLPERIGFDGAVDRAEQVARSDGRPGTVAHILYSADLHAYGVALARTGGDPRAGLGPDWYYVDTRDGTLRSLELAGRGSAGDLVMQSRFPLHTGLILGSLGQLLVCIAGLATAILSVTGVAIWARKRRARANSRHTRTPAAEG